MHKNRPKNLKMRETRGFRHIAEKPELNLAINVANMYIDEGKVHFLDMLEDAKDLDAAIKNAPNIHIEELNEGDTPISDERPTHIVLNSKYTNILTLLHQQGRSRVDITDYSFAAVSFYVGITILHEFCHFLVRYKSGKRESPLKLRRQHRGERVDIGSTIEITFFQGILRLVQHSNKNFSLILDVTYPSRRLWIDMNVVCKVCSEFTPILCLWND